MVKWTEAFHIYVAMVAEKTPTEIGNLTLYAQTIQRIANSCGDHTARLFVGNFGVEGNETLTSTKCGIVPRISLQSWKNVHNILKY